MNVKPEGLFFGTFKEWLASPLSKDMKVFFKAAYPARKIQKLLYSDNPFYRFLPKAKSFAAVAS